MTSRPEKKVFSCVTFHETKDTLTVQ